MYIFVQMYYITYMYYTDHASITGEEFGCKLRCFLFYGRLTMITGVG